MTRLAAAISAVCARSAAPASRTSSSGTSRDDRTAEYRVGDRILAASGGSLELAIAADQRVGRAVVLELWLRRAFELGNDALGERLAQLHAPLVEGIDLPDRALREDAVLVERDQLAERCRRQARPA